jgi:enterochelin esterase family protein
VSAALDALLLEPQLDAERLDRFLDGREFPIVEGRSVTFVYRGAADEVRLRHWIFGLPSSQPFQRVGETDLWRLTIDLPPRSRVEYKIEVVRGGSREWILDPRNPKLARDPFGANSVAHADGYETPEWTLPDPEARRGALEEMTVRSPAFGDERTVVVYLPARFRRRARYPLLIVHDGGDYLRYASLRTVLDNLTHRLEIPSMVVALTHPVDRMREYGADERHARHLVHELVPLLEQRYPLIDRPESRGLVGASLGAVATLHASWKHPGFFGRLLTQSGSFAFSDIGEHHRGTAFDDVVSFVNRLRENPGRFSERLFVTCGMYESLIYENRSLVPQLQGTGMDVHYVEARDGHNWENWRDRLREGLSWLFPGPLWMVYE